MAPKKRKMGTRMDAALDQMSNFGFSKPLVRKTVTKLLKLYDGEWRLIEEDGYRVLLEVILEEQETAQTDNMLEDAPSLHDNPGKELVIADHSNEVAAEGSSLTNNAESNEKPLLPIEGLKNKECVMDDVFDESVPYSQCSRDAADNPVYVQHKPCYGWISDDDSDDDETNFIELKPST